ncbi:hypothetical protein ACJMK2_021204 [Sinanodonta woodiana]|uniref:Uncharacterized protein n=1 Tax=Sinanodonta woodiana TaxID=1069815 RepID=A0ABD3U4H6_SINWO
MDDFGDSNGGFSSSDALGCLTDACGCSALSSSDTGGISSSGGMCSDSIPYNVDTFSNIVMTSDSGQGVNDYVSCNLTGNNAYYHASVQNSMESENINDFPTQMQEHSSYNTDTIPASPIVPCLTTPKDVTLDGYQNKLGHVVAWRKNSPLNKDEDNELMFLRYKIAQMEIILASSIGDEYKKAALKSQIQDLTSQMERQETQRGKTIYAIKKCQEQKHVPEVTKVKMPESNPEKDTDSVHNRRHAIRIMCYWIIIAVVIAIALGVGLGVAQSQKK